VKRRCRQLGLLDPGSESRYKKKIRIKSDGQRESGDIGFNSRKFAIRMFVGHGNS
jgi:hypothetical protein